MKVVLWGLFALLCLLGHACCNDAPKVVCYYASWAVYRPGRGSVTPQDLDPNLCTHLVYVFAGITKSGELKSLDPWADLPSGLDGFGKALALKNQNPNLKVLIGVGGFNAGTETFSHVARDPALRQQFAQNAAMFVDQYGFDGVDMDWEYPAQADRDNFSEMLRELSAQLRPRNKLLTAAVPINPHKIHAGYDAWEIMQYLDLLNLMAYDMHGVWDGKTGMNAPMTPGVNDITPDLNVNSAIQNWLNSGASADKMVLGIPFYGRTFKLSDRWVNDIGAPTSGSGKAGPYTGEAGNLGYNELCLEQMNGQFTERWSEDEQVPFAFEGDQWVSYDNSYSVALKAQLVEEYGLAGVMVWSVDTDDVHGDCGQGTYPLLRAIWDELVPTMSMKQRVRIPSVPTPPRQPPPPRQSPGHRRQPGPSPANACHRQGYVRDPQNCQKYHRCLWVGQLFRNTATFYCPNGQLFDIYRDVCDYQDVVIC